MSDILSIPELTVQLKEQGFIHTIDPDSIATLWECPECGEAEWILLSQIADQGTPMCKWDSSECVFRMALQKLSA